MTVQKMNVEAISARAFCALPFWEATERMILCFPNAPVILRSVIDRDLGSVIALEVGMVSTRSLRFLLTRGSGRSSAFFALGNDPCSDGIPYVSEFLSSSRAFLICRIWDGSEVMI